MRSSTVVYLGPDDLTDSAVSPIFTGIDGEPWCTLTLGSIFAGVVLHNDPVLGANPINVAETLERLAGEIRTQFSRWVASPESDTWTAVRDAIATAEAITQANAPKVA